MSDKESLWINGPCKKSKLDPKKSRSMINTLYMSFGKIGDEIEQNNTKRKISLNNRFF